MAVRRLELPRPGALHLLEIGSFEEAENHESSGPRWWQTSYFGIQHLAEIYALFLDISI